MEKYFCSFCKKVYKTSKSLWYHNYKFHSDNLQTIIKPETKYNCMKCNKEFDCRFKKYYHQKNVISMKIKKILFLMFHKL
jgi:hypothetical protein